MRAKPLHNELLVSLWVNAYLQDGTIGYESDVGDLYLASVQGLCKFSKLDM